MQLLEAISNGKYVVACIVVVLSCHHAKAIVVLCVSSVLSLHVWLGERKKERESFVYVWLYQLTIYKLYNYIEKVMQLNTCMCNLRKQCRSKFFLSDKLVYTFFLDCMHSVEYPVSWDGYGYEKKKERAKWNGLEWRKEIVCWWLAQNGYIFFSFCVCKSM